MRIIFHLELPCHPHHELRFRLNFAAGFFGVPEFMTDYHQVITVEEVGFNNTLAPYETCINANNAVGGFGSVQANKWAAIYLQDAVKRLQPQIKGINLTIADAFGMQTTCAYEVRVTVLMRHLILNLTDSRKCLTDRRTWLLIVL